MNLWFNIPFATIIIGADLSSIPNSIIESARDVGASKVEIFKKIILPLTAKSALVAIAFVFMSNVGAFTTPFLMGSNSPIMLGVALYQEFGAFYNLQKAAAISVFMFIICSIVGAFYIYSIMREDKWNLQE
jgi:ABC-type spermidine/putrescine transport system permease subunit I